MNDLLVEYLAPGELIAYANNARKHSTEQMRQLERSIREFGFVTAILVDEQDRVVAGHGPRSR
jgi:ParB-like chromosome segregation protein Spo0J